MENKSKHLEPIQTKEETLQSWKEFATEMNITENQKFTEFLESPAGDEALESLANYMSITQSLQNVVEAGLPTSDEAEKTMLWLDMVVGQFMAAAAESMDLKETDVHPDFSDVYERIRDLANNQIPIYVKMTEMLDDLSPELEQELLRPEYGGKGIEALYSEFLHLAHESREKGIQTPRSLFVDAFIHAHELRTVKKEVPRLKSTGTPKQYVSPNTALANALLGNDGKGKVWGSDAFDLPVANLGKKNEVTIYVHATLESLDGDESVAIKGKPWSEYDSAVHDAVCSIYLDRVNKGLPPVATDAMIWRVINNKTRSEDVSDAAREGVARSIEKQGTQNRVFTDVTEEVKLANPKEYERLTKEKGAAPIFRYKDFLLPHREYQVVIGKEVHRAYYFHQPPLLDHAMKTNKLVYLNPKLLDIQEVRDGQIVEGNSVPDTKSRITVRQYMLRRLVQARGSDKKYRRQLASAQRAARRTKTEPILPDKPHDTTILMGTLFSCCEITSKESMTDVRKYVLTVLDNWVAIGEIKGYEIRKKGKSFDAVTIKI